MMAPERERDHPGAGPPARPGRWEERAAHFLLIGLGPRRPRVERAPAPARLAPFERFTIPRRGRPGTLDATWYPAPQARGAVLLLHPWMSVGQAYFHRRGRLEALREAGYHALAFDFPGFGESAPPAGLYDRDVEDALAALAARAEGLPLHVWGVSSGGFWALVLLSRRDGVAGAMFEDVTPHPIGWSRKTAPWFSPAYHVFERLLPRAYRFLDLRRHVPFLHVRSAAFSSGALDRGIAPADTEELARGAGGSCLIAAGAAHLGAIKRAPREVIGMALDTFEDAARSDLTLSPARS